MDKFKEGAIKFAKWAGGLACVIIGLSIGGFGLAQFLPEKKYGGGDVTVKIPEKPQEDA
jgi:hypothetical protein